MRMTGGYLISVHRRDRYKHKLNLEMRQAAAELGLESTKLRPLIEWLRSKHPPGCSDALNKVQKVVSSIRFINRIRFSESYLAVKGAALILPQSECTRTVTQRTNGGDIGKHLQSMFYLLRPQDTIKVAVKLESSFATNSRYLAVVSTMGRQDTEECVLLGIDIEGNKKATVGLILPVLSDVSIYLDGDGGFTVSSNTHHHIFKPVSVQAMWSALQSLNKIRDEAIRNNYFAKGLTHTWISYYEVRSKSEQCYINEWNQMEDLESVRNDSAQNGEEAETDPLEKVIKTKLREVMMTVDLEEVTCKFLRIQLEEQLGRSLRDMRHFLDQAMITIMGQMDAPSQIFDFLYLGSEWNASNLEELKKNGVEYILNVTREIDNFFPGLFEYYNVRLYDEEKSELMKHWDDTFKFINKARLNNSKVLVHCKMGVSRSASTVMAFAMKEYGWNLEETYKHVKQKRSCVTPNDGFMQQLKTYQGILDASKQRHNKLWRSASVGSLPNMAVSIPLSEETTDYELDLEIGECRPRSWSPADNMAQILMKTQHLASDAESTEEEMSESDSDDPCRLALHSQDPPHIPFLHTLDDWEEYEISSRSADSLDECLSDIPEPSQSLIHSYVPVVLLSYTSLHANHDTPFETAPHVNDSDSDSDCIEVDEERLRPLRGFYDMTMLTGCHDIDVADLFPTFDEASGEEYVFLHPDVKLEFMISQARKQLRIAKLLKLSQALGETHKAHVMKSHVTSKSTLFPASLNSRSRTPTPLLAKLKPDDFWIKDILDSPAPDAGDSKLHLDGDEEAPILLCDSEPQDKPRANDSTMETIEPSDDVANVEVSDGTASVSDSPEDNSEAVEQYVKEDIPWSPGTVRRTALELQTKYSNELQDSTSEKIPNVVIYASSSEEDLSHDGQEPWGSPPMRKSISETCMDIEAGFALSDESRMEMDVEEGSWEQSATSNKRPVSLYETEDIELEPGLVQRTRKEIEERERSGSLMEISPTIQDARPVQRSSSWKTDRESSMERSVTLRRIHDRNSERRRTCLPVLTPTQSFHGDSGASTEEAGERIVLTLGDEDGSQQQPEGSCMHVYQIGVDEVHMAPDTVKRRTMDFEGRQEVEAMLDDIGGLQLPQQDKEHERSQSPFIDEGLEIKAGSVRRQTESILRKYNSSAGLCELGNPNEDNRWSDTEAGEGSPRQSLSMSSVAFPDGDIPWNTGTVRQHREAFESKEAAAVTSMQESGHRMNKRLLSLIESVGTAFVDSPPGCKQAFVESPRGKGMVSMLVSEMEGYSTVLESGTTEDKYETDGVSTRLDFGGHKDESLKDGGGKTGEEFSSTSQSKEGGVTSITSVCQNTGVLKKELGKLDGVEMNQGLESVPSFHDALSDSNMVCAPDALCQLPSSGKTDSDTECPVKCSRLSVDLSSSLNSSDQETEGIVSPDSASIQTSKALTGVKCTDGKTSSRKTRPQLKSGLVGKVEGAKKELLQRVQQADYVQYSKPDRESPSSETSETASGCKLNEKVLNHPDACSKVPEVLRSKSVSGGDKNTGKDSGVCGGGRLQVALPPRACKAATPTFEDADHVSLAPSAIAKFEELEAAAKRASSVLSGVNRYRERVRCDDSDFNNATTGLLARSQSMSERKKSPVANKHGSSFRIPMSPDKEPDQVRKVRRLQGKTHPLSVLSQDCPETTEGAGKSQSGRSPNPLYNTM